MCLRRRWFRFLIVLSRDARSVLRTTATRGRVDAWILVQHILVAVVRVTCRLPSRWEELNRLQTDQPFVPNDSSGDCSLWGRTTLDGPAAIAAARGDGFPERVPQLAAFKGGIHARLSDGTGEIRARTGRWGFTSAAQ